MTEKPELEKDAYGDIIEPPLENDYGSKVDSGSAKSCSGILI